MGSEFLKTVFDALLAMASCDGELHEDEVEVLEAFKVEFSNELKSERFGLCFTQSRRML